jgi:hypothetical protein
MIFAKHRPVLLEKIKNSILSVETEYEMSTTHRAKMMELTESIREEDNLIEERSHTECFLDSSRDGSSVTSMITSKEPIETGRTLFEPPLCKWNSQMMGNLQ